MARIRTVKPDLFTHEGLHDAEREHGLPLRLAFIGLFTIADREGRFKWRPREIKLDVLPYDDNVDFAAVLGALCANGFVVHYEVAGEHYGYIPTFKKHQVVNTREAQSRLPDPVQCTETHAHACALPAHAHGERDREEELEQEEELEEEQEGALLPKRAVVIAVRLRRGGVDGANASNPHLIEWADDPRVTDDLLDTAIGMMQDRKPTRPGPNYMAPIIEALLNPRVVRGPRNYHDERADTIAALTGKDKRTNTKTIDGEGHVKRIE